MLLSDCPLFSGILGYITFCWRLMSVKWLYLQLLLTYMLKIGRWHLDGILSGRAVASLVSSTGSWSHLHFFWPGHELLSGPPMKIWETCWGDGVHSSASCVKHMGSERKCVSVSLGDCKNGGANQKIDKRHPHTDLLESRFHSGFKSGSLHHWLGPGPVWVRKWAETSCQFANNCVFFQIPIVAS